MNEPNVDDALLPRDENNNIQSMNSNNYNIKSQKDVSKSNSARSEIMFAITFIGRIIMTLHSFHGLFFIYNFIIQYIILVPGILFEIENVFAKVFLGIIYIFFAICTSNILVIPTYDFLLFPFLNFRNPLYHLESLPRVRYILKNQKERLLESEEEIENKNYFFMDIFLIAIETFYILGYLLALASITKFKDVIKIIILFIIYTYYLVVFIGYILISIYLFLKLLIFSKENNSGCFNILKNIFDLNSFFGDPEKDKDKLNRRDIAPLPKINLLSYIIHPQLKKSYNNRQDSIINEAIDKKHFEDYFFTFISFARFSLFIFSFILICCVINKKDALSIIFFLIFFILTSFISIFMNFPVCFRNKKTFGYYWIEKIKYKKEYRMKHPSMVTYIRFIWNIIITLIALLLFFSFFYFKENNDLKDINKLYLSREKKVGYGSLLLPTICYSSIHNIDISLYMPFINDAYYYNGKAEEGYDSSLNIVNYKQLFFDDSYKIYDIRNLINNEKNKDSLKMIQYNVKNDLNEVTILSIAVKKNVYIEFQLYFPSILLNFLSSFSILGQQKESSSFKFIEFSFSIPYRLFFQYSVIDSYLKDLEKAYNDNYKSFYNNVVIVGHSLGGGLAKLLGRFLGRQAISLSGPGINAFHTIWGYEEQNKNFEISAVDLVPDMDLIPRVEVSGGISYRIICKNGIFGCHYKAVSLCEVLIMCRNPNYEFYCKNIANLSDKRIKELYESSELKINKN